MDTGKGLDNDGAATKVTGLQGGMLAGRALAVVVVADGHPLDAVGLVVAGHIGNSAPGAAALVLDVVHLVVLVVGGANEHVVGDVVQVAAVLQPGAGSRDVIGGALALDLDQDGQIGQILAVPLVEGLQQLQALRLGIDSNLDLVASLRE